MKKIEKLEEIRTMNSFEGTGICPTVFRAYDHSLIVENELIDFNDSIWDNEIPEVVETLKKLGVKEFTVSSGFSSLTKTLWAFIQNGCTMNGMVEVNTYHRNWNTQKREQVPAVLFEIK